MFSTHFWLMAEFGTSEIRLDDLAERFFGLSVPEAKKQAQRGRLPVAAYRLKGQKSPWLVSAFALAEAIDAARLKAEESRQVGLAAD